MATLAQGTQIFFIDPDSVSSEKIVQITCPKSIDPGTPSTDEHDTTNLCSDAKEKFIGLTDWGTANIVINFSEDDDSHKRLVELSEEVPRATISFVIGLPDPTKSVDQQIQPTLDENGEFVLSTDRGWRRFRGQVKSVSNPFEAGNVLEATVEIGITKRDKTLFRGRAQ